jgi:hypothetical protein
MFKVVKLLTVKEMGLSLVGTGRRQELEDGRERRW